MIVVMPAGHAVLFAAPRDGRVSNNGLFEEYLTKEVIPIVESKYRVAAGSRNRVLAGLSMGVYWPVLAVVVGPAIYAVALIVLGEVRAEDWRILRKAARFG